MKLSESPMFSNPFLPSPFAPAAQAPAADARRPQRHDPDSGPETYELVQSAPDVPAEDCETAVQSLEVRVLWGASVLHVAHLTPPRSFFVGEEETETLRCDYLIPAERIGAPRLPLVLVEGGVTRVVLPRGATGTVDVDGAPVSLEELVGSGRAEPCAELAGAHRIELARGARALIAVGDFAFELAAGNAGRVVGSSSGIDRKALPWQGLSAVLHLGLLASIAAFMPPLSGTDDGGISAEHRFLIQAALGTEAEKEQEPRPTDDASAKNESEGGTGARAVGDEGKMGSTVSKNTNSRYGIEGPEKNTDVRISREQALSDARDFGMLGLLNAGAASSNSPTAPWGDLVAIGNDPKSAMGNMWGESIDDAAGSGGLGLSGVGEMGGGNGLGIGLGTIGTYGHGSGLGPGQGFGPGAGGSVGRNGPGHRPKAPRMQVGVTSVSGKLPPEIIQRIVRQNFGRFRNCYESGLRGNPNLQGRVAVGFIIGRDGAVSNAQNAGSDLPDSGVVSCVVRAFYGLSFPQPDGGIVRVTYPIMLTPG